MLVDLNCCGPYCSSITDAQNNLCYYYTHELPIAKPGQAICTVYMHEYNLHDEVELSPWSFALLTWVWNGFLCDGTQLFLDGNDMVLRSLNKNHYTRGEWYKLVSVHFMNVLVSTSCMQDSSQSVVVVADHISHSSSSQCHQHYHDFSVSCLCVKGVERMMLR